MSMVEHSIVPLLPSVYPGSSRAGPPNGALEPLQTAVLRSLILHKSQRVALCHTTLPTGGGSGCFYHSLTALLPGRFPKRPLEQFLPA